MENREAGKALRQMPTILVYDQSTLTAVLGIILWYPRKRHGWLSFR